jgi:hypothetical protein
MQSLYSVVTLYKSTVKCLSRTSSIKDSGRCGAISASSTTIRKIGVPTWLPVVDVPATTV